MWYNLLGNSFVCLIQLRPMLKKQELPIQYHGEVLDTFSRYSGQYCQNLEMFKNTLTIS